MVKGIYHLWYWFSWFGHLSICHLEQTAPLLGNNKSPEGPALLTVAVKPEANILTIILYILHMEWKMSIKFSSDWECWEAAAGRPRWIWLVPQGPLFQVQTIANIIKIKIHIFFLRLAHVNKFLRKVPEFQVRHHSSHTFSRRKLYLCGREKVKHKLWD